MYKDKPEQLVVSDKYNEWLFKWIFKDVLE